MLKIYKKRKRKPAPPVTVYPCGREVCSPTPNGMKEYRRRRHEMVRRQGFRCAICNMAHIGMDFDHQDGRGSGGSRRDDRILDDEGNWKNAALCRNCNGNKGSKRYMWTKDGYYPVVKEEAA